jgi:integrase
MKKSEFPKVVKVGQTKATIYYTPSHGCAAYTVAWYEGAARKRKSFGDYDAAELHANVKVKSLALGEAEVINLSGEDRLSYVRSRDTVAEFGLSLDSVAVEYRDAKRLVRDKSLVDVARYYAEHQLLDVPNKSVQEVYEEMLKAKKDEGLSERYIEDLKSRVGKFAEDFKKNISSVTGPEIKTWLQALTRHTSKKDKSKPKVPVTNRTRNNFRLGIQTLFSFAKSQRYLALDWNGMEAVPLWKTKEEEVEIFTPDEMSILLCKASDSLVPFLTIGAFAGLRSAEIERLDWSKVNLKSGYIMVDASIAKTNSRRLVPIVPNLRLWLEKYAKTSGKVVEITNVPNAIQRLVDATRPVDPNDKEKLLAPTVRWKHNALRHSFISCRLALVQSAAQVALEAGNSPQMIFKHYRELVRPEDAKTWFGIEPVADGKVMAMPKAVAA